MSWKAREGDQLLRQRQHSLEHRAVGIETRLAQPLAPHLAPVPPLNDLGEPCALLGIQAKYLAEIAQRASRPVHDHGRRYRGTLPAVLPVDVLDDLLAPLVLEIDVDVGRLVALAGDEALEEERCASQRVDRGHPQAITDAGVGGRAPALTQNFLAAREGDDIVHGQKVRLVTQVRDEGELMLDGDAFPRRHAVRPAPARAGLCQLA